MWTLATLVVALTLAACGDAYVLAPNTDQQRVSFPEQLMSPRVTETMGDRLGVCVALGTIEARGPDRWVFEFPIPAGTTVFDGVVAEHLGLDAEVFVSCGCNESLVVGQVSWWPETAGDGVSSLTGPQVLFQGPVGSVFRSVLVWYGQLLVLDANNKVVHRLEDTNADGLWDSEVTPVFANAAMFGSETPLTLSEDHQESDDDPDRVEVGSTRGRIPSWQPGVQRVFLTDADHNGVAEQLVVEAATPVVLAPASAHSLVAGLDMMRVVAMPLSTVRVVSATTVLATVTLPADERDVVVSLSRALVVGETVVIHDDTNELDSEEVVVTAAAPVVVQHVLEQLGAPPQWTGWKITLEGAGLSVGLKAYLTDPTMDVAEGTDPPELVVSAGAGASIEVQIPMTFETGLFTLTLEEFGEEAATLPVLLERPPGAR